MNSRFSTKLRGELQKKAEFQHKHDISDIDNASIVPGRDAFFAKFSSWDEANLVMEYEEFEVTSKRMFLTETIGNFSQEDSYIALIIELDFEDYSSIVTENTRDNLWGDLRWDLGAFKIRVPYDFHQILKDVNRDKIYDFQIIFETQVNGEFRRINILCFDKDYWYTRWNGNREFPYKYPVDKIISGNYLYVNDIVEVYSEERLGYEQVCPKYKAMVSEAVRSRKLDGIQVGDLIVVGTDLYQWNGSTYILYGSLKGERGEAVVPRFYVNEEGHLMVEYEDN